MAEVKSIEVKGKTLDEAIFTGLTELGLGIDQVSYEIIKENSKGLFGIGKSVVIRMNGEMLMRSGGRVLFRRGSFASWEFLPAAQAEENEDSLNVELTGDSTGVLIGRRGETLDALQYLTGLVVNKGKENYKRVTLDTENYRKKREETLVKLANRIAGKVARTGKRVVLEPMNPYERRILHATLQNNPKVETISEGEEPYRRVIIKKKE